MKKMSKRWRHRKALKKQFTQKLKFGDYLLTHVSPQNVYGAEEGGDLIQALSPKFAKFA